MTYSLYAHKPGSTKVYRLGTSIRSKSATTTRVRKLIRSIKYNTSDDNARAWTFTRTDDTGTTETYDRTTGTWKPQRS